MICLTYTANHLNVVSVFSIIFPLLSSQVLSIVVTPELMLRQLKPFTDYGYYCVSIE